MVKAFSNEEYYALRDHVIKEINEALMEINESNILTVTEQMAYDFVHEINKCMRLFGLKEYKR